MNFHFSDWLTEKIYEQQATYGSFDFEVMDEQDFFKITEYSPNKIYVVVKALTPDLIFQDQKLQPYQILIMCEEDTISISQALFTNIGTIWNYKAYFGSNGLFVKFSFTTPVVMSNFNEIKAGYRSILYMTSNLIIMENVADIENLTIDGKEYFPLSINVSYSMSPDTQQMNRSDALNYIAESVKSASSFAISMSLPLKYDDLEYKIVEIMNEERDGNDNFVISFDIATLNVTKNVKLIAATITTAPNQIPNLQLGFIK